MKAFILTLLTAAAIGYATGTAGKLAAALLAAIIAITLNQ